MRCSSRTFAPKKMREGAAEPIKSVPAVWLKAISVKRRRAGGQQGGSWDCGTEQDARHYKRAGFQGAGFRVTFVPGRF